MANVCKRQKCGGALTEIEGERWDRDGMRNAKVCGTCRTRYKSYAAGLSPYDLEDYRDAEVPYEQWPVSAQREEREEFHVRALARGYVTRSAEPSLAELRDAFAWWEHPLQGGERRIIYLSHRSVTPKVHRVYRDGTWEPLVDFIVRAYHEYLAYQYGHEPVPDAPDTIP